MAERRIVVTGVSQGLGQALVHEFIAAGHHVAGCARSKDAIADLAQTYGAPHHFSSVDVASDGAVSAWAKDVLAQFGTPDLLINNAGVINENAPLWEVPADQFAKVMDVNVKGVHSVIRHFLPNMIEAGEGVIVNLSSGWGRSVSPMVAPYCGSKWAIEGMTKALAEELPDGLAAVPVNPGVINTPMLQSCFGDAAHHNEGPEEWAREAAPFMLSLSAKDNGQSLTC